MKKTLAMILMLCMMLTMLSARAFADGGYQIQVVDEAGIPVEGVMVQFCTDSQCMMGKTDTDGIAAFDEPAGTYTIHLLKVPAGYAKDSTEYEAPETPDLVVLTIHPEGTPVQAVAAANSGEKAAPESHVIDAPMLGLHFEAPEALRNLKGQIKLDASFIDEGLLNIPVNYFAVSKADNDAYKAFYQQAVEAVNSGKDIPSDPDHPSWLSGYEDAPLYDFYVINGNRGEKELREMLNAAYGFEDADFCLFKEIGSDGENHMFLTQFDGIDKAADEIKDAMGEEFFDEYLKLFKDPSAFLSGLKLSAPEWPNTKKVGDVLTLNTTDLDGNAIDSAELFAKAKVTMVNCWATWCGPCKGELPELGEMAKELEAQGCQLVGLCIDAMDDDVAAEARSILNDAGAAYLNLRFTDELEKDLSLMAYPTTFFVDSEGKLLAAPFEGADPDTYRAMLADCLAQLG